MIRLEGVSKQYRMGDQTVHALQGIDLHIRANEMVAFIGASGSGKSTMMNIVGCLDRPSSGEYWLNGRAVATMSGDELASVRNREIGFIFQSFHLLPRASALDNVAQPLIYRGVPLRERLARAEQALQRVGLGEPVTTGILGRTLLARIRSRSGALARILAVSRDLPFASHDNPMSHSSGIQRNRLC